MSDRYAVVTLDEIALGQMGAHWHPVRRTLDIQAFLPAMTIQLRIEVLLHRQADAEIGDQRPALGNVQRARHDFRLENGNPANSQSLGARRKP